MLLVIVGCPALSIAISLYRSVRAMLRFPEVQEDVDSSADFVDGLPKAYRPLLVSKCFQFANAYAFHSIRFGVWVQVNSAPPLRYFSILRSQLGGAETYEFITVFTDTVSLTTTTTRSAFVHPRCFGNFLQAFPGYTPEGLWAAHLTGEEHLTAAAGISAKACQLPFLERLKQGIIRDASHVTSFPLWFVRGIYWYSCKRFLLHNKPIWRQNIKKLYRAYARDGAGSLDQRQFPCA